MFNLFGKPQEEIAVVFDIGSGSVGGALVKFSKTHSPVILYSHRQPITFLPHLSSKRLLSTMEKLLTRVADHIVKEGLSHVHQNLFFPVIKDVFCVYSSPWFVSQTKVLKVNYNNATLITEDLVDALIEKEQKDFLESKKQQEQEYGFSDDTRVLEKKIIDIKLNGYHTDQPFNKKAKELELVFFSSFSPEDVIKGAEQAIHKVLNYRKINHHSYSIVSWSAIRDIYPDQMNFLFVDISGEMTDISIVINGVLLDMVSFPTGRSGVLRKISKKLNLSPELALSTFNLHMSGISEKEYNKDFMKALSEIEAEYVKELSSSLININRHHIIPKNMYVTVDHDVSKFFLKNLNSSMSPELSIENNKFDVTYMGSDLVENYFHSIQEVESDPFIGIECVYINKLLK